MQQVPQAMCSHSQASTQEIHDDRVRRLLVSKAETNNTLLDLVKEYKEDTAAALQKLLDDRFEELVKNTIARTLRESLCREASC
jgi:hypothetical protein